MKSLLSALVLFCGVATGAFGAESTSSELWAASAKNIFGSVELRAQGERLDRLKGAFQTTLKDLGYLETETKVKDREVVLGYRTKEDEKIFVKLKEFPEFTHIKIRIGVLGNDALSREILKRVHRRL